LTVTSADEIADCWSDNKLGGRVISAQSCVKPLLVGGDICIMYAAARAPTGVAQGQTRRKAGAQNFRSNGMKANDSGVAGAI
jgi:hypothetical protein